MKLENIQVQEKDGKLLFLIDTNVSIGTTKDGSAIYFANTGGPIDLPNAPGVKMTLAVWYREPVAKESKTVNTAKPSGVKVQWQKSGAVDSPATVVKVNRIKG